MTPERWEAIHSLFFAAAGLDPPARAALLTEAGMRDATLRDEVAGLLHADSRAGQLISETVGAAARHLAHDLAVSRAGERVGPYRLVRELGHGGMGTVYLAERADDHYRAWVAIKFVRGAYAAPELERRFRAERQILADLTHPNIARLLDGGATPDGTPYLVMEYLDGDPVDAWCDRRRLGLRDRILLFLHVCDAVQHAHQARVVHRDIKPSNVVVTTDGTPKLVDFGIAKLLGAAAGADPTATLRILTPAYASPEQVRGGRITFATDIYSLGALLYRVLAGRPPLDLTGATPGEIERRICGERPRPPSEAARRPHVAWRRELVGELDEIVLKALRKEPEKRHGSVAELAAELRRWLAGRPGGRGRALRLALRRLGRHRLSIAAGVVLVVALVTSISRSLASRAAGAGPVEFLPEQSFGSIVPAPFEVRLGDLNGDGRADLILNHREGTDNAVAVALAGPAGTFEAPAGLVHNPYPSLEVGWEQYRLLVGDVTGDGRADLVWNATTLTNDTYSAVADSGGGLTFHPLQQHPTRQWPFYTPHLADIDGDGDADLVWDHVSDYGHYAYTALSRGDGTFALDPKAQLLSRAVHWIRATAFTADLDGDGRADLLLNGVATAGGRDFNHTLIAMSLGAGRFSDFVVAAESTACCTAPGYETLLGDFNGDRVPDLLWHRAAADTHEVFVAAGVAGSPYTLGAARRVGAVLGADPVAARLADVNADGRSDVIWYQTSATTNEVAVGRGTAQGLAVPSAPPLAHPDHDFWNAALPAQVGDIDGDGRDDIVWVIPGPPIRIYVARGGG